MPSLGGVISQPVNRGDIDELMRSIRRVPSSETVWHYTTGEGLLAIIESRTLWATQISCLNDSQELKLSINMLETEIDKQRSNNTNKELQIFFDHLSVLWKSVTSIASASFVVSFSELGDDLSQWRAYGGVNGENGYCIGFDRATLSRLGQLTKIAYSSLPNGADQEDLRVESQIQQYLEKIITKAAEAYPEVLKKADYFRTDAAGVLDAFVNFVLKPCLEQVLPCIKHGTFYAERECRLLHTLREWDETELRFRQKTQMMTRHLPLGLRRHNTPSVMADLDNNKHKLLPLPVRQIIVGPARHQSILRHSVEALLKKHGHLTYDLGETEYDWGKVSVTCSSIPLQST